MNEEHERQRALKDEWRDKQDEIRRVLMQVWDPIGVKEFPEAVDEYDCCVSGVFGLLKRDASGSEIADYLWKQATEHMGLTVNRSDMYPTIAALRKLGISGVDSRE